MMAKSVIKTDLFMDMPMSTQCLYFHLLIRADDDGFVKNPSAIRRETGCNADDMKLLIAKQYIIPFENGVIVIRHWRVHNWVRGDRKHPTDCKEIQLLSVGKDGIYELKSDCLTDGCQMVDDGLSSGCQVVDSCHTEDRLGKDRLGKDRLKEKDKENPDEEKSVADAPLDTQHKGRKNDKELSPFELVEDEALREALLEYRNMRKHNKSRMTEKAEQLALSKLRSLTHDLSEAVEIVNQSIMNSWKGLFPLKRERVQSVTANPQVQAINEFLEQVEVVDDEAD